MNKLIYDFFDESQEISLDWHFSSSSSSDEKTLVDPNEPTHTQNHFKPKVHLSKIQVENSISFLLTRPKKIEKKYTYTFEKQRQNKGRLFLYLLLAISLYLFHLVYNQNTELNFLFPLKWNLIMNTYLGG